MKSLDIKKKSTKMEIQRTVSGRYSAQEMMALRSQSVLDSMTIFEVDFGEIEDRFVASMLKSNINT